MCLVTALMIKNAVWLFCLAIFVFVIFLPSYTRMQDLRQKNAEYAAEIADLKRQHTKLKREKMLLEKDPIYLEKVAREKMGLIREGEVVYRLNNPPVNAVSPKTPALATEPKKTSTQKSSKD